MSSAQRARLVRVTLWRLLLAAAAWVGLTAALTADFTGPVDWFEMAYFSEVSTLAVALTATGGLLSPLWTADGEGRRGVLRGASTTYALLTMIIFATLLSGDYRGIASLLEHLVVPLAALVDWLVVGRTSTRVRPWWPLLWLVVPLAYLPVYVLASAADGPLYDFLDPRASDFGIWVAILLVGLLVLGYALWALARLRGRLSPPPPPDRIGSG